MPEPSTQTIQLRDKATGQPVSFQLGDVDKALASGKYEKSPASYVTTTRLGTTVESEPTDAVGALSTGNEQFVNPNIINTSQTKRQQKEALATTENKALTFAEGITDALTFGLARERGEQADIRRGVNPYSALAGEITGMGLGMVSGGPLGATGDLARLGESGGQAVAKQIFKDFSGVAGKIGARTLGEAGANAAIATAQATGHQIFDSILEDKPMAAEAILHEAGMGVLLGAGFGALHGIFGKAPAPSTASVKSGADIGEFSSQAAGTFRDSIEDLRQGIRAHETRVGVLQQLIKDRVIPSSKAMTERLEALKAAQLAEQKMAKLGSADWAINADARAAFRWQQALEDLHVKTEILDKTMTPKLLEVTERQPYRELGLPEQGPIKPEGDVLYEKNATYKDFQGLNERMGASPELRAKYKEIWGEEWSPVKDRDGQIEASTGEENLGGKPTPTSSNETRVLSPKAKPAPPLNLEHPELDAGISDITSINPNKFPVESRPNLDQLSVNPSAPTNTSGRPLDGRYKTEQFIDNKPTQVFEPTDGAGVTRPFAGEGKTARFEPKPAPVEPVDVNKPSDTTSPAETSEQLADKITKAKLDKNLSTHQKYKKLMDDWFNESKRYERGSPASKAVDSIDRRLKDLNTNTNGRLDAVDTNMVARNSGFGEATTAVGARFQQAWSVSKLTKESAKVAKMGSGLAIDEHGIPKSYPMKLVDYAKRRIMGRAGATVGLALLGKELGGGEGGYYLGASLAAGYLGFGGKVAGTIGALTEKVAAAGEKLLSGRKATVAAQAINLAKNNSWSYSDKGPIEDPIKRIQEIHNIASHPEYIQERIIANAGDLNSISPDLVDMMIKLSQHKMKELSIRAPKFMWDRLGKALPPEANALRKFLEYENAINDANHSLEAIKAGSVTKATADGFTTGFPSLSLKLNNDLLSDPVKLQAIGLNSLRAIETLTGADLTGIKDGKYILKQQEKWQSISNQSPNGQAPGKPQAFKINSNKIPATTPTVNQSMGGRAPGNQ